MRYPLAAANAVLAYHILARVLCLWDHTFDAELTRCRRCGTPFNRVRDCR